MAKLTSQLGSSMVNDVEFGYGHNAIITTLSPQSVGLVSQTNAAIPTAWPSSLKQKGAYIDGGGAWGGLNPYGGGPAGAQTMWTIAPYGNHEDLYAIQDNISKVHGNHLFKAGAYYSTNKKIEYNNGGNDAPAIGPGTGNRPHEQPAGEYTAAGEKHCAGSLPVSGSSSTPTKTASTDWHKSVGTISNGIWATLGRSATTSP